MKKLVENLGENVKNLKKNLKKNLMENLVKKSLWKELIASEWQEIDRSKSNNKNTHTRKTRINKEN